MKTLSHLKTGRNSRFSTKPLQNLLYFDGYWLIVPSLWRIEDRIFLFEYLCCLSQVYRHFHTNKLTVPCQGVPYSLESTANMIVLINRMRDVKILASYAVCICLPNDNFCELRSKSNILLCAADDSILKDSGWNLANPTWLSQRKE